jgi:hypothetical protein
MPQNAPSAPSDSAKQLKDYSSIKVTSNQMPFPQWAKTQAKKQPTKR